MLASRIARSPSEYDTRPCPNIAAPSRRAGHSSSRLSPIGDDRSFAIRRPATCCGAPSQLSAAVGRSRSMRRCCFRIICTCSGRCRAVMPTSQPAGARSRKRLRARGWPRCGGMAAALSSHAEFGGAFVIKHGRPKRRPCHQAAKGLRGVWQQRFWEHTIRDEDDWRRHMDYITSTR